VELIVSTLGWVLLDVLLVSFGRLAVFVLSLGRWRGERVRGKEARIFAPAGALSFVHEGRRVVTRTGLLFAGVVCAVFTLTVAFSILQS
jgi:hypothetical protein